MGIRLDLNNKAVNEATAPTDIEKQKVGGEAQLDAIMTDTDLFALLNSSDPISGETARKLQEATADPRNIRIVCDESAENFYIDYSELMEFSEASGLDPYDAVDVITEFYEDTFPKMTMESVSVVFPSKEVYTEACQRNYLGYKNIGYSAQFFQTCKDAGLKTNTFCAPGVTDKLNESVEVLTETDAAHEQLYAIIARIASFFKKDARETPVMQKRLDAVRKEIKLIEAEIDDVEKNGAKDSAKSYRLKIIVDSIKRVAIQYTLSTSILHPIQYLTAAANVLPQKYLTLLKRYLKQLKGAEAYIEKKMGGMEKRDDKKDVKAAKKEKEEQDKERNNSHIVTDKDKK